MSTSLEIRESEFPEPDHPQISLIRCKVLNSIAPSREYFHSLLIVAKPSNSLPAC